VEERGSDKEEKEKKNMKGEEKKRKIKNKKWDWNEGGNVGEIKKEV